MSDRWNHRTVVVDTPHPPKFFVPGEHGAESREHPAGFKVRVRGAGGTVVHAYRCPVHGLFDARVERANAPDEMLCMADDVTDPTIANYCGRVSPWAGSFCGQGKAAGECAT